MWISLQRNNSRSALSHAEEQPVAPGPHWSPRHRCFPAIAPAPELHPKQFRVTASLGLLPQGQPGWLGPCRHGTHPQGTARARAVPSIPPTAQLHPVCRTQMMYRNGVREGPWVTPSCGVPGLWVPELLLPAVQLPVPAGRLHAGVQRALLPTAPAEVAAALPSAGLMRSGAVG